MSDPTVTYRIHPAIGFPRVGNAPDAYYLEPTAVGGLPTEAHGPERPVTEFKESGQVKRQAARFRIYRYEEGQPPVEVSPGNGLSSVQWTVHIANKKACWYNFQELQGDVMLGPDNTYEKQGVPLRNPTVTKEGERKKLIIDPGPRTLTAPGGWVELNAATAGDYKHVSFPSPDLQPYGVTTLGRVRMTERGELLVLGGYGNAGGPASNPITTFGGADGWYDDVGDGPVVAQITTDTGDTLTLHAWVVSGAPKLAPELVNVTSLADTFIDVGVRQMGLCPALYRRPEHDPVQGHDQPLRYNHDNHEGYQRDYIACWERDILPIFRSMKEYRWVANVDAMVSVATPPFDLSDLSDENRENRRAVFRTFRRPEKGNQGIQQPELSSQHQQLFGDNGFPLMPLNSGDNSISNTLIEKFMAITPTQYWLLHQWAEGKCVSRRQDPYAGDDWLWWASPMDIATAGNAVGEPMAPGIEVTWTMRNPDVVTPGDPFRIKLQDEDFTRDGLSPSRDETLAGDGCQPGDLTKRMAIPWQADFFDCSVQDVNFTTPATNKTISNLSRIPLAPTFYSYWWPPQSPFNVYSGADTASEQLLDANAFLGNSNLGQVLGQNVLYHRGLNSFMDSVVGWKYLGFILNRTTGPLRDVFPFFVERERSYEAFASGYQGLTSDGQLLTTQPTTITSALDVNSTSQNVFPLQWLIGN
ncbi:MAG TPA: CTQ-dependent lysine 6-oxidase LodA [Longimicrobium sp.]|nr:CTQ-dependent lysine 6-oxidase LodA [Longimicrobium sp.]